MRKFKIVPNGRSGYSVYRRFYFFFWIVIEWDVSYDEAREVVKHESKSTEYF
jgi:hypothetical protein